MLSITDVRIILSFIGCLVVRASFSGDCQLLLLLAGAAVCSDVLGGFLIGIRNKHHPIILLGASFVGPADEQKADKLPLAA